MDVPVSRRRSGDSLFFICGNILYTTGWISAMGAGNRETWALTCVIAEDQRDIADGIVQETGYLGAYEQDVLEGVRMTWYFATHEALQRAEYRLMTIPLRSPLSIQLIADQDWNAKWRETMQPAYLGDGIWVAPVWRRPRMARTDRWIKIEPKMAFGTGHHETTRLAAGALSQSDDVGGGRLLDIGAGSGILCFVADICGADFMMGVEIDPDCAPNLAENREANPTTGTLALVIGGLDCIDRAAFFDVAVMNMLRSRSEPLLPAVASLLKEDGTLIWSGLLTEEIKPALGAANRAGFVLIEQSSENEWWCGVFRRC
ncbi:MAG: hypothetical protein GF344_16715 [Chitinivibrionales bacterium]|nr:hypothetical protein [Chitinivibrionales bacterium]MBD3358332.1 hypothetical protein [Chitinivibrionales bacterium]